MPRRDTRAQERQWKRAQRAEQQFARNLRRVAKRCADLTRATFKADAPMGSSAKLRRELERYGQSLQQWAKATAQRMVADVARRDEKFWFDKSREMGNLLKTDFARGPLGVAARERVYEAASLISSLPLEAAQRVEKYSIEFMTRGIRANEFAKRIMNTGEVTKSRANLIARTETSRTAGILQQVRAESVGSEGYIWRTSMDIDVRDRHRKLEGKFFRWDDPPVTGENGERSHPGGIYNCRCWAEVVLPGERHPAVGRKRRVTNASPTRASRFRAEPVDE